MAKSPSFFGLRTGSTKSLTFQILNGKQITKDRVYSVRNPQTTYQMIQRAVFATVTQAADKMLPIIGISQQGLTNETEARRRWVSQNVKVLREAAMRMNKGGAVEAAFAPKGNTQLIPNSYAMSRGSLSMAAALTPKTTAANGASFGANAYAKVGVLGSIPTDTDLNVLDAWRLLFGLAPGDQLTFPQIYGNGTAQQMFSGSGVVDCTRYTDFCAPRIVLKQSSDETFRVDSENPNPDTIIAALARACELNDTWYDIEGIFIYKFQLASASDAVAVTLDATYDEVFAINNDDWLRAIGCIRSHRNESNGSWQYSTSALVCVWAQGDKTQDSDYFGFTLAHAVETYRKNVAQDAEGNFLQRGTDSSIVPDSYYGGGGGSTGFTLTPVLPWTPGTTGVVTTPQPMTDDEFADSVVIGAEQAPTTIKVNKGSTLTWTSDNIQIATMDRTQGQHSSFKILVSGSYNVTSVSLE